MADSHSRRKSVRVSDSAPAIASADPSKDLSPSRISEVSLGICPTKAFSPFQAPDTKPPTALPELRRCTVGYRHRYVEYGAAHRRPEPPPVPFLPLQGRWLKQAGFDIGTAVRVLVTSGRLVLEVETEGDDRS